MFLTNVKKPVFLLILSKARITSLEEKKSPFRYDQHNIPFFILFLRSFEIFNDKRIISKI